jgi:hypothetical protein
MENMMINSPITGESAVRIRSKNEIPRDAIPDLINSNEYYEGYTHNGTLLIYKKCENEVTSPWQKH